MNLDLNKKWDVLIWMQNKEGLLFLGYDIINGETSRILNKLKYIY